MSDDVAIGLAKKFVARRDVKAWQQPDGAYYPDETPIKLSDLRAHLAGERTMGHYVLGTDDTVNVLCFDIDLDKKGVLQDEEKGYVECNAVEIWHGPHSYMRRQLAIDLRCMAEGLARRIDRILEIPVAVVESGNKGLHVYGFTDGAPARDVREAAKIMVADILEPVRGDVFYKYKHDDPYHCYECLTIEIFPKQDSLQNKKLGNLLRFPLGVHRETGNRSRFIKFPPVHGYDLAEWEEMAPEAVLADEKPFLP